MQSRQFNLKKYLIATTVVATALFAPNFLSESYQDLMIFMLINILVASSYRLMTLTGEWSLIHVVMMGVGAYAGALLTTELGLSFWIALPLAACFCALIALLLAFPLFRLSQFYFLIGSFAAGESIRLLWIYFVSPFGGTSGISDLPYPELGTIDFGEPIIYYYLTFITVASCLFILYRIEHSRVGLTLHAVHWKASLAESVGINTQKYRTQAFVISSFFVGIAGVLSVHYIGNVSPKQFNIDVMVFVLIWVIVGGYNTFYGPMIGVFVLTIADEFLRGFQDLRPAIYGLLLIGSIMFMPNGLENFKNGPLSIFSSLLRKSKSS